MHRRARPAASIGLVICSVALLLACAPRSRVKLNNGSVALSGLEAFYEGDYRQAERLFRSAIAHNYSDSLARYYLAKAYLARGSSDGRIAAERTLSGLSYISNDPLYLESLVRLRLRLGYRYNATRDLDRLIEVRPEDADALFENGRIAEADWWRYQVKEDREKALRRYGRALEVNPVHRAALIRLAVTRIEEDSIDVAARYVDRLARAYPDDFSAQLLLGVLHERRGEYEAAEAIFRRAVEEMTPYDRSAYLSPEFLIPDSALAGDLATMIEEAQDGGDANGLDLRGNGLAFLTIDGIPRGVMGELFWATRDPTPTTPTNERFVVHASRMAMADFLYGDPQEGMRGWEMAPGEYYVRYGKPVRRRFLLGGHGVWVHTFDIGNGTLKDLSFHDYSQNGVFMRPIDARFGNLTHVQLEHRRPEASHLEEEVTWEPSHALAWFRSPSGEPRLELAIAVPRDTVVCETSVRDDAWNESYRTSEAFAEPEPLPVALSGAGMGLVVVDLFPGRDARHVEVSAARSGRISRELADPPAAEGFEMSDLSLGFKPAGAFVPNPGLPFPREMTIAVRFEIYGVRRDARGIGYAHIEISVIPEKVPGSRAGRTIASLFGTQRKPSYVTSQIDEEITADLWPRVFEIDPAELSPGVYRVEIDVKDSLTGKAVKRASRFELKE
jgi:tetratricopeptide (TPR) repeat protein